MMGRDEGARLALEAHLHTGDDEDEELDGYEDDGQVQRGLTLAAEGAEVRLGPHVGVAPAAAPALQRVDRGGGVDGVEEGHADQRGREPDEGRHEAH